MAIAWVLRDARVTSALIGASSVAQLRENVAAVENLSFSDDERALIDAHAGGIDVNIWSRSSDAGLASRRNVAPRHGFAWRSSRDFAPFRSVTASRRSRRVVTVRVRYVS